MARDGAWTDLGRKEGNSREMHDDLLLTWQKGRDSGALHPCCLFHIHWPLSCQVDKISHPQGYCKISLFSGNNRYFWIEMIFKECCTLGGSKKKSVELKACSQTTVLVPSCCPQTKQPIPLHSDSVALGIGVGGLYPQAAEQQP